jgi:hypothetical protein
MDTQSAVNQPHPDEHEDAAAAFFGDETVPASPEPSIGDSVSEMEEGGGVGSSEPLPEHTGDDSDPEVAPAYEEPSAFPFEAAVAAQEPAGAPATPEGELSAASTALSPARGDVSREYIVFHKVHLTSHLLQRMLAHLHNGGDTPVAYVELHRGVARNDKQVISAAYALHKARLGDTAELAAVSARSFKERHVAPEEVPAERRVRIT